MKLALGTVQFGVSYGINNSYGIPDNKELTFILNEAYNSGIRILDTAPAYGNAEHRIAKLANHNYSIVTKFSEVFDDNSLKQKLTASLKSLKASSLYGYIAHNANELIEVPKIWSSLLWLKNEERVIKKIGYSIYTPQQLEILLNFGFIPDLVQLPYSILDRKFESYITELKNMNVEIHTRSVFLQGLYFMNPNHLPVKLLPLQSVLRYLHELCTQYEIPIGALALNYVYNNNNIDNVVVGVETSTQLQYNLDLMNIKLSSSLMDRINEIEISNPELLNPGNWRK